MNSVLLLVAMTLAAVTATVFDRITERRGFLPPGFKRPGRRTAALLVTGFVFLLALFSPLSALVSPPELPSAEALKGPALFATQALLLGCVVGWFLLGYGGVRWPKPSPEDAPLEAPAKRLPLWPTFARQFGLVAENPWREVALGLGAAAVGWMGLVAVMLVVFAMAFETGQMDQVPTAPPELVPLLAGLPVLLRVALSLSAGVVEELFFRGFLQARVGVWASTAVFAVAHLSYGQPFMLIGITVLSLFFSALVVWRRSILAAVVAHFAFDAFQLLIVIPLVLQDK